MRPMPMRGAMRRGAVAAAAAAAAMLAAALLAGGGRAAAQEAGGCFEPRPRPGYTLAAFAGGGLGLLERCAEGLTSRVHATGEDGAWLTLDPGADGAANAAFRARYAGGAAAGTPFLLERTPRLGLLVREPGAFEGYTLLHSRPVRYLLDMRGRIVHSWDPGWDGFLRLLENGRLLGLHNGAVMEADPASGNVTWEYRLEGSHFHHDFVRLPSGNVLLLARRFKTRDEAVAAGADPAFVPPKGLRYEAIVEVRPTRPSGGEIVWEWSLWDHLIQDFDPDKANYGDVAAHPELVDLNFLLPPLLAAVEEGKLSEPDDWIHANSIDYHPGLDQIVISARNFSELWIIDHSTTTEEAAGHAGGAGGRGGDLLYRWGNPRAHRAGTAADQRLFWPHHVHWIEQGIPGAGNLLMFNNGLEFGGHKRGWSSVVEIAPPADGRGYRPGEPAEPVWTYEADPPAVFYSAILSGAQRLPNGNTLIASGVEGAVFEVTPAGDTVWRYVNPGGGGGRGTPVLSFNNSLYRATRYAPDYPGLAGLDLRPKGTIEPPGPGWRDEITAAAPAARGPFAVYLDGYTLTYVRDDCAAADTEDPFFVHAWAADPGDLPAERREAGFEALGFAFGDRGVRFGDTCMTAFWLPDYEVRSVRTGQYDDTGHLWDAEFAPGAEAWLARFDALAAREPDARGAGFALRLEGRTLTLAREACDASDIADRFFVHAYAPDGSREAIDFWFRQRGERHGDRCLASVVLPPSPLARLVAGQYDASGHLWEAELPVGE